MKRRRAAQTHGTAVKIHGPRTYTRREARAAEEAPPQEEADQAEGLAVVVVTEQAQEHILEGHRA